jgi:hypothetical protein
MNEDKKVITVANNYGSLIIGLLGVLFVGLKLTEVIDWSWWYVTLPFWAIPSLIFGFLLLIGITGVICALNKTFFPKKRH